MWQQNTMGSLLSTAVVVGSFALAPEAFALALTDFALFSLNDQVEILDDVIVTNPSATLVACPPLDCATEAGKGFIGTGINGVDTAIGSHSTLTGIRTGAKVDNSFSHYITINGDIVSASGPVKFGNNFIAGNITSGEDIEFGHNAYTGDLNASDEVEILDTGILGHITVGTGNIQLGSGTTSGSHTVTGIPLAIDAVVPSSLPVTNFTGGGNTFVNGQVFTPGQYFFDSYLPDKNQGVTFDFTPDPKGKIEIFVEDLTTLQQNFDITVTLGANSCTVAEIFNGTSDGRCTDPLGLRPLAAQVVLESHGSFQIRDGADFFGTGIVPVSLHPDAIGIEVKGQGVTGFVIGALYAMDKVKLGNDSQLQYVGLNQAPRVDCWLLAIEDHGPKDAEFIVQATASDPEDGPIPVDIELIGIDDDGQKAPLGSLAEGDLVRLQVDKMKIQLKNGNHFAIRAKAHQFRLKCSATDSGGLSGDDSVTVDQDVTELVHDTEPDVSEEPIQID